MRCIKGPAVFLAQFLRDEEPFANVISIGKWFAGLGYKGVQVPAWDRRVIDLDQAATSRGYCDDYTPFVVPGAAVGIDTCWLASANLMCLDWNLPRVGTLPRLT